MSSLEKSAIIADTLPVHIFNMGVTIKATNTILNNEKVFHFYNNNFYSQLIFFIPELIKFLFYS